MIGAILGDIIGSRFEFRPTLNENFELLTPKNTFTDDTILMIAVADALINNKDMAETLKDLIMILSEFYRNIRKSNYLGGNNYENDCN